MRFISSIVWTACCCLFFLSPGFAQHPALLNRATPGSSGHGSTSHRAGNIAMATSVFTASVCDCNPAMMSAWMDGAAVNLSPGITYRLDPGPYASASISPVVSGNEQWRPVEIELTGGDAGTNLQLTFVLPNALRGEHGEVLGCSFPSDGLVWREKGERLNPNAPVVVHLDPHVTATFQLGIILSVPETAQNSMYRGDVLAIKDVTGM